MPAGKDQALVDADVFDAPKTVLVPCYESLTEVRSSIEHFIDAVFRAPFRR